jgi:hypothetical protein
LGFIQNAQALQDRIENRIKLSDKTLVVISSWAVTFAHISFASRMVFNMWDFYVLYGGVVVFMIGPMLVFIIYRKWGNK